MTGRRGGRIVRDAVLKRIEPSLLREKVVISRNADQFLQRRAATGIFLRSNPTHYEVMHELMHYQHFKKLGARQFSLLSLREREQHVYDALRNRYWTSLNQAERLHATAYTVSLGGNA